MKKFLLTLCLIFIALGQSQAQLRLPKAEARDVMSKNAYTVETKTTREGNYEFTHRIEK
jgi:hypothetical protein